MAWGMEYKRTDIGTWAYHPDGRMDNHPRPMKLCCGIVTALPGYGDSVTGERLVYLARKRSGESLIIKSGAHRGIAGTLYDAKCWIERPTRIKQEGPD